jgi:hypothetical protein
MGLYGQKPINQSINQTNSIGKTGHHYVKKKLILCFSPDLGQQCGGKVVNTINNAWRRVQLFAQPLNTRQNIALHPLFGCR